MSEQEDRAQDPTSERPSAARRRRLVTLAGLAAVLAVHALLLVHFVPPDAMFSGRFILDYSLQPEQIQTGLEATRWGHWWAYDPLQLGGRAAGLIQDASTRGVVLASIELARCGVPAALAFNLLVFVTHAMVPFVGFASSRAFGFPSRAAVVTAALWVVLWFFDSFLHWAWFSGMFGWLLAAQIAVVCAALWSRLGADGHGPSLAALALLAALLGWLEPYAALPVAVAGVIVAVRARRIGRWQLVAALCSLAAFSGCVLLTSMGARDVPGATAAGTFRPTLDYLLYDAFDLLKDARNTGGPVRTMFRTLCFVSVVLAVWRRRGAADPRTAFLGWVVATGVLLTYTGGHLPWLQDAQPYCHVAVSMFAAAVLAGGLLIEAPAALRSTSVSTKVLLLLAAVALAPRVVRTVLQYLPKAMPKPIKYWKVDLNSSPLVGMNEPKPLEMGHEGPPPRYEALRRRLLLRHRGRGRVLVREWGLAQYLTLTTGLPILGGPVERIPTGNRSQLFRLAADGNLAGHELTRYFERHAVGFVVLSGELGPIDFRPDAVAFLEEVQGFRIFVTRAKPAYVARGSGRVASQGLNSIRVTGASGPEVVLRFGWLETLRCRPGCVVERSPWGLRVPHPPAAFEIYNAYPR